MLVILEGCDGAGKSTLANKIAKIIKGEVIHCTKDTPNDYTFFHNLIELSKTKNIIADRFMYGQFVYQKPEERKLNPNTLKVLEAEAFCAGSTLVLVEASPETIKERLSSRCEVLINGLTVEEVLDRFNKVTQESFLEKTVYNTDKGGFIE